MFGDWMRVPVTSILSLLSAAVCCAIAVGAAISARAISVAMTQDFFANAVAGRFL
jgi:hypothetical protein